jgi:hypothetical protein
LLAFCFDVVRKTLFEILELDDFTTGSESEYATEFVEAPREAFRACPSSLTLRKLISGSIGN